MTKICTKCGIEKDIGEFCLNKAKKDGHRCSCKKCQSIYRQGHKEETAQYYQDHKEEMDERSAQYRQDHKEETAECGAQYYQTHKEEKATYLRNKYKTDPQYKLRDNLRCRINEVLKGKSKSVSTVELLGCTIEHAIKYFLSLFTGDMTITDYMEGRIHRDEIIPCSSFDLTDPEQQKQCFHYTNLQPLWAKDNLSKGAKIA